MKRYDFSINLSLTYHRDIEVEDDGPAKAVLERMRVMETSHIDDVISNLIETGALPSDAVYLVDVG